MNAEGSRGPGENGIGTQIVSAAMTVHSAVGPGLLESAYELCLTHELSKRRMRVRNQVHVPIRYDGFVIDNGYRLDLLVEELVIIELKSVETILPVHRGLLSYLRLGGFRLGYLLNFNVAHMRDGITRLVNCLE